MTSSYPWTSLFTLDPGYRGDLTFRDARVAVQTRDKACIVSSPNVEWVPEPVFREITVVRRADGFFGIEDPAHHPQLFCASMPWLAVIPTPPTNELDLSSVMWRTMKAEDFMFTIPGSQLGILQPGFRELLNQELSKLVQRLEVFRDESHTHHGVMKAALRYASHAHHAFQRLHSPATFRETLIKVALVQRFYLYLTANVSWFVDVATKEAKLAASSRLPTNTNFIGALCHREQDVQVLLRRGIPAWYVQAVSRVSNGQFLLKPLPAFKTPSAIITCATPAPKPSYSGVAGSTHLMAIFNHSHACSDDGGLGIATELQVTQRLRPPPAPASVSRHKASAPRASPYPAPKTQPRAGRDKFQDPEHKWMPAALPAWSKALANIDRSSVSQADMWRYWIPEPALLLGPKDADRLRRYILNWVRIREAWLYAQRRRYATLECPSLKAQDWREVLNVSERTEKEAGDGNRSQQRKSKVMETLATTCGITDFDAFLAAEPLWFSLDLSGTLDTHAPRVMWELFDLGFRAELHQLDRYLRPIAGSQGAGSDEKEREREREIAAVFPDGRTLDRASLPSVADGLSCENLFERAHSLEALRKIMVQWPTPPASFHQPDVHRLTDREKILALEAEVASYYTQCFFDAAGRPPILPHMYQ